MEKAFVIGNGQSRSHFDLNTLRGKGTIYGCNALYRDFLPDVLIATDDKIREEIELSEINPDVLENIPAKIPFYTRRPGKLIKTHVDRKWQDADYENRHSRKIEHNWGYSSGPVALTYACLKGGGTENPNINNMYIYFMGFDLMGIGAEDKDINNIYSGTNAYKPETASATYYMNWVDQIRRIMLEYKSINFTRVGALNNFVPEQWKECSNHREITFEQFEKEINNV
jgi:hypothetical protein